MSHEEFPDRIETERLEFERLAHDRIDRHHVATLLTSEEWHEGLQAMPWFRFETVEQVAELVDNSEEQWANRESARYLLRRRDSPRELVGTAAFMPEWKKRRATGDVVLSTQFWGNGYGLERAEAFLELAFVGYEFDIYYTSCAPGNERSRRMIETLVDRYDGRYEGRLRNEGAPRPDGTVTDQHRYSISRAEYEQAKAAGSRRDIELCW